MEIIKYFNEYLDKDIKNSTNYEIYNALVEIIKKLSKEKGKSASQKKLYYISAEFLIGKLLINNLINLNIYDEVKDILSQNGKNINEIEECENEPSLGNGGLGRLAACFLDSIATLGLNGDGIGINYHFGLFKQLFVDNKQVETPNRWLRENSFLSKTNVTHTVNFKNFSVDAIMYDIDVIGYKNTINKLHLFDIKTVDEDIVTDNIKFNKKDIKKNLSLFLYPDDSDKDGKILRIYQQYFMVSCAAKLIIDEALQKGSTLYDLDKFVVIQINDTHPSLIIPELIYNLGKKGIEMEKATEIVSKICAYTNHTILQEALEKYHYSDLENVVPHLMPIICYLDKKIKEKYSDKSLYIIDENKIVQMANMDIHYTFSTNGVAELHTKILKESELNSFYKIYPHKFNNKTNGITFRRWLFKSNPTLTKYIENIIGPDFKTNALMLKNLENFKEDINVLDGLEKIKLENKKKLINYISKNYNISIDENSIFDMQIKRLHEYKRQQLNILYLINMYLDIKNSIFPKRPVTAIFGAKAAPAYTIAKDIIHLILCMQKLILDDKEASKYIKIFMVENYNVSAAEILIPACEISEQISLASKEASGTGNMKFMLNGAVTLGTLDGANIEIKNLVGDNSIYIFGDDSKTVIKRYKDNSYCSKKYYEENKKIKRAVDFIISDELTKIGDKTCLQRLYNELINKDWFMTFPDYDDYEKTRNKAYSDYENRLLWSQKMLVNIANAGFFSSDRTIYEYNNDLWKL